VIIEHPAIAAYYTAVFLDDWNASKGSGAGAAPGPDRLKIILAACILVWLIGLYLYRRRRT